MISKYFYFYNCNFENETQLLKSQCVNKSYEKGECNAEVHVEARDLGQGQGGGIDDDGHVEAGQENEADCKCQCYDIIFLSKSNI